ncbi:MAG TPA: HEAT repeat domain-containing protein [Candidatus Acidoferrales bacterium]|jgi:hypothetical protein|nr:HEAT repeat domain-containing protein [Candidatus Acidoferrales bacterium]
MTRALWVLAAALPLAVQPKLAAQPKLLINAKLDTRPGANLQREVQALLTTQPQPAWIMYSVPAVRTSNLGCDYVRDGFSSQGVIHLEPPDHGLVLFRVEGNAVTRIRALSPNCEIDAGDVPVHWLTDVQPAESIALLNTYVPQHEFDTNGAISAIAMHADPAADAALERFVASDKPDWLRQRTASLLGSTRGRRGLEILKNLIASDPSERVRERAISGLGGSREADAVDLLISIARTDKNSRLRMQAISSLNRKSGPKVVAAFKDAIETDPDVSVRRRAVSALQNMPDGEGVPLLIQMVKTTKDAEVRKQAMNSLGQSHDTRAMAFFEDVLKH